MRVYSGAHEIARQNHFLGRSCFVEAQESIEYAVGVLFTLAIA